MRAAAVQLNSTDDKQRNLATADRLTRQAAAEGADLVVLRGPRAQEVRVGVAAGVAHAIGGAQGPRAGEQAE